MRAKIIIVTFPADVDIGDFELYIEDMYGEEVEVKGVKEED